MVDRGFHFGGPRFFLKILVDRGLVDRGSEKLSTTLFTADDPPSDHVWLKTRGGHPQHYRSPKLAVLPLLTPK